MEKLETFLLVTREGGTLESGTERRTIPTFGWPCIALYSFLIDLILQLGLSDYSTASISIFSWIGNMFQWLVTFEGGMKL
jgi:hypothetical protein